MADLPPIDAGALEGALERMSSSPSDRDRGRILRSLVGNFTCTCDEALRLVRAMHDSPATVAAAVSVHAMLRDQERFEAVVLAGLRWEEERQDVRDALAVGK